MSAASYNRGSRMLSRLIDGAQPSAEERLLNDLTNYSAAHTGLVTFGPGVVRFGPRDGEVSLMNHQHKGWSSSSYTYRSLWTLARAWRLAFVGLDSDQHGRFVRVVPMPLGSGIERADLARKREELAAARVTGERPR